MLDTNNNTADNKGEDQIPEETPQSILEKRLAELNARKINPEGNFESSVVGNLPTTEIDKEISQLDSIKDEVTTNPADESRDLQSEQETATQAPQSTEIIIEDPHLPESNTEESFLPTPEELSGTQDQDIAEVPLEEPEAIDIIQEPAIAHGEIGKARPDSEELNPGDNLELKPEESLSTAGVIPALIPINEETVSTTTDEGSTTGTLENQKPPETPVNNPSEEEHEDELHPEADYSNLAIDELRTHLLSNFKTATRKSSRTIFALYKEYETKLNQEKADALNRFKSEGGEADDFAYHAGPAHQEVEKAFQLFRENRFKEQRQEEEQKVKNSRRKHELLEELRHLVESPETKSSSDKIKIIQAEWKSLGAVPPNESQQLWNSYHALLDIFYNNRSIFNELKDLDRRKNLQHKILLCERAEVLSQNPSINVALQDLRHLHEEWKHVGPVPNDQRDNIWDRFIQASEKIHARKKEFITERKAKEQENLTKKTDLLTQIEPFQAFTTERINDWRDKTDEIQKLKEEWDGIGLVPKEKADEVNKRFWSSYKSFFNHKNAFFKALDDQKMQNLRQKTELCEQAELLKDSEDWDETKEILIQLQKKWKTIGRVPDKYSDKVWQRFRTACNAFFDRKQNQVQQREAELNKASAEKNLLLDKVTTRLTTLDTNPGTIEELEAFRTSWTELDGDGHNRVNGRLEDKFYDLLSKYAGSISSLSNDQRNNLTLEIQITRLKQSPDAATRIYQKEQSIRKEIATLENDIRTLKTNIEFFARSKNAEKLREEYQTRIDEADNKIGLLQQQLHAIRNM